MKFVRSITGVAGSEFAMLLAIAATVLALSGYDIGFETIQFAHGNF
jgi:hypothetical protein